MCDGEEGLSRLSALFQIDKVGFRPSCWAAFVSTPHRGDEEGAPHWVFWREKEGLPLPHWRYLGVPSLPSLLLFDTVPPSWHFVCCRVDGPCLCIRARDEPFSTCHPFRVRPSSGFLSFRVRGPGD